MGFFFGFISKGKSLLKRKMSQNSTDCLECRLVSGGGLLCIGLYIIHCSQKLQNMSRFFLLGLGPGVGILGVLRIFDLPPFKHSIGIKEEPKKQNNEQENYIVGKLPSKFR